MAVLTKCPKCETVFRVSAEQLRAAGGWVRCGRCATEFNAVAKLTDSREDRAVAINLDDANKPESELRNLVVTGDRSGGGAGRRFRDGGWRTALWSIGSLALLALLGAQYLWNNQATLALDPEWRPWVEQFCGVSGCEVAEYHDLDALELRKRDLRLDANRRGVLIVNAILVNRAPMQQAFPTVELNLKDRKNKVVASRRFQAHTYMGSSFDTSDPMTPETPYHLHLELLMPEGDPVNFGFQFL